MKKTWLIVIGVGLAAILVTALTAQSFGGRMHHGGMAKGFLFYKLDKMSKELNLNPSQQQQLDLFKSDLEKLIDQRREKREQIHEAVAAELAKPNPDLNQIKPLIDGQIDEMAQIGHDLVGKITVLYQGLTPEQKKMIGDHIQEHMKECQH